LTGRIPGNPVLFVWGEEWNFWMERIRLVQLNLGTKKALVLLRNNEHNIHHRHSCMRLT
jgi:hypothetical protein